MIKRELQIQNFRNLGINKDSVLLLNPYLTNQAKEHGDLLIIIGPNNVGKSNILDALEISTSTSDFSVSHDINSQTYEPPLPNVFLYTDKNTTLMGVEKKMVNQNEKGNFQTTYFIPDNLVVKPFSDQEKTAIINDVKYLNNIKNTHSNNADLKSFCESNVYKEILNTNFNSVSKITLQNILNLLSKYRNPFTTSSQNMYNTLISEHGPSQNENYKTAECQSNTKLAPNVLRFSSRRINMSEFSIRDENINNIEQMSPFICNILNYFNYSIDRLKKDYASVQKTQKFGIFEEITKNFKKKTKEINAIFNDMFPLENKKKYTFELVVDSGGIAFSIAYGGSQLQYDQQSEGFKWFFDFFFNFLLNNTLEANDIVIIDEPCMNIHENGVKSFHDTVRDFAYSSGITFVVVTHRVAFIDINNLDELRVVGVQNGVVDITNEFHILPDQNCDVLKPILNGALASRNMLFDNRSSFPIFVEGITDYCYLTGYKNSHKNKNDLDLIFLPVEGLGQKDIITKIEKQEIVSILLVDEGYQHYEDVKKSSKNVILIKLSDIDEKFNYLEDLFSNVDRDKYGLGQPERGIKPKKNFCLAHYIKRQFLKKKAFSQQTLKNFEKVFKYLSDTIGKIDVKVTFDGQEIGKSVDEKIEPTSSNENE